MAGLQGQCGSVTLVPAPPSLGTALGEEEEETKASPRSSSQPLHSALRAPRRGPAPPRPRPQQAPPTRRAHAPAPNEALRKLPKPLFFLPLLSLLSLSFHRGSLGRDFSLPPPSFPIGKQDGGSLLPPAPVIADAPPAPAPALACPRRCPRPGRPRRGRGSARPPRARLAAPGRCPRLCGRAPRAEPPPPPAAPGLCVRAPGAGSWVLGAARPGAGSSSSWVRGARGPGPEAGAAAAEVMSGSSGGATAPAASSGPAAAASAAGSGCGGGAGEGAEEAAKDLADIAAFFRSGESPRLPRALGRPGAPRSPARYSPARSRSPSPQRGLAIHGGVSGCPRRPGAAACPGRLHSPSRPSPLVPGWTPLALPLQWPRPRGLGRRLFVSRWRAEEAAAGTAWAEAGVPEDELTGAGDSGALPCAGLWAAGSWTPDPIISECLGSGF